MTFEPSAYLPISCEFHDQLEIHAMRHKPVRIRYRDLSGMELERDAIITDVFARDGADYLTLSDGELLRLDQLIAVNEDRLADY